MANLIDGLGGTAGFGENTLFRNDDLSSAAIDITSIFENGLDFFGVNFTSLFINNNGNLTFTQPLATFIPFQITGGAIPGLFAFFDDIDTRGGLPAGPTPGGTSQGTNSVYYDFDTFNDRFIVTWDDVGQFSASLSPLNAFQLVIQDRSDTPGRFAGDFDFEFRYESINWSQRGTRAGYSNGDGISFFELPASGNSAAILALDENPGNTGVDGLWRFSVTNGTIPDRVFLQPAPFFGFAQAEGDGGTTEYRFTVQRVGDAASALTVDYAVGVAGLLNVASAADFVGGVLPSGSVTFAAGATTAEIVVAVQGDLAVEPDESFTLVISNPVSAGGRDTVIARAEVDARIVNDDVPPSLSITSFVTAPEGNSGVTPFVFTLTRTGDVTDAMTVDLLVRAPGVGEGDLLAEPSDLAGGDGKRSVTFAAGSATATLTVGVVGDTLPEPRESFFVDIVGFTGGDPQTVAGTRSGTGLIQNDDGLPPVVPIGFEADIFGDPHLVTLDGLSYDFQAVGEFVLLETVPGDANPFQVQIRTEAYAGSSLVSVTTRLAVEIGGVTVEIDAKAEESLLLDGVTTSIDPAIGSVDVDGDGTADVFFDGFAYTLVLNGLGEQLLVKDFGDFLNSCVFLDASHQDQVRGLLGNANGQLTDDLARRDGTVLSQPIDFATLYGAYADSWRLDASTAGTDKASLFTYAAGEDTVDFTDTGFPNTTITLADLPPELVAAAQAAAVAAGITDPLLLEAAILDFALTGEQAFLDGASSLAADPQAAATPTGAPPIGEFIGIVAAEQAVVEGDSGVRTVDFTVYRIGDLSNDRTVSYAIAGTADAADFAPGTVFTGSVTFTAGEAARTISLAVTGDTSTEANESVVATITASVGIVAANATTIITTDDLPPVAFDDAFGVFTDTTLTGNLLAGNSDDADLDPDGDPLTVMAVNGTTINVISAIILPSGALLTIDGVGRFTYDPNGAFDTLAPGATADDSFTYTLSDGQGGTDIANVTVTITGADGDDVIVGTIAAENLSGGVGRDDIGGRGGDDTIDGGVGNDTIRGGAGRDLLLGGDGDDVLRGRAGGDTLRGGDGNDFLRGGNRADVLEGGAGADILVYGANEGRDTIEGFEHGIDVIRLVGFGAPFNTFAEVSAAATQAGADTLLDFGGTGSLRLVGIATTDLTASDFGFV